VPTYLTSSPADPAPAVALASAEGAGDGRAFLAALRRLTAAKPLVMLKGGAAREGQRAAASHTGSLATDDRVFDGLCRQLGILRAPGVEQAFEWAATLATRSEEHTSELQSLTNLVCRLLLEKKNTTSRR